MRCFYLSMNYHKASTAKTPGLDFDFKSGKFVFTGRSIPENSILFFEPVKSQFADYLLKPAENTILEFRLEYFNTSSAKCILEILRQLENSYLKGVDISIKWYYEDRDEDMKESGEDFKEILKIPLELKALKSIA